MNASNATFCDFREVRKAFSDYYNYLSLVICIFGSVTNVLNICVLTTKQLRCPTYMILTGLALANLLVMLEYIPFVFVFNQDKEYAFHFTHNLAVFVIVHAWFTQAFHFISCVLAVILAIWQYVAVKFPQENNKWCSVRRTKVTVLLVYLLCSVVCVPLNLSLKIWEKQMAVDGDGRILPRERQTAASLSARNDTIYVADYENEDFQLISSYVYGFVIKLVPCILLTVLSSLLIVELLKAKERKRGLMSATGAKRKPSQRFLEKQKETDRTTRMLLAVLLLFLMVEFPQAIFGMLNIIIGKQFELECYQPLGDIVDVLTLTNSSINFILYCIMSKKFRLVFKEIFFPYIPCCGVHKENWTSLQTLKTYV